MYILPQLPVSLPEATIPTNVDLESIAERIELVLNSSAPLPLVQNAVWRDLFALTGTLRTFYTSQSISVAWDVTSRITKPTSFVVDARGRVVRIGGVSWVELPFVFETEGTPETSCNGVLSVVPEGDEWKIWCLRTILANLKGPWDVDVLDPVLARSRAPNGDAVNGVHRANGVDSLDHVNHERGSLGFSRDMVNGPGADNTCNGAVNPKMRFDCVVVGGGQAGLAIGGRLQALGISYVVLDKHSEVGDSWKTRYDSTKLHTIREYSHLPFDRTFPKTYPEFLTGRDLAMGHQSWVSKYKINIWQSTTLISGSWGAKHQLWTLKIRRNGQQSHLTCSHTVFATGSGGQVPLIPKYENQGIYKGLTLHSQEYKSASKWAGRSGVVIGTANTGKKNAFKQENPAYFAAHDVAEDMLQANLASVTMVQRSSTYVVPEEYYNENQRKIYNADIPTEIADRNYLTSSYAISRLLAQASLHSRARQETERFDALESAGFKLDRYGEIMYNLYERQGGHYMDVGASAKIAKGLIRIKSDALPVSYTEDGLIFDNGDHLKADIIVFATGFLGNLRLVVADIFGDEIAKQVDDFWGLDEEGEIRGAYRPSGHQAFWYHGGTIGQARYFSRFIALQIKAKLLGTPFNVYRDTPHQERYDNAVPQ